ncbi:uncharacterized protein LOC121730985 [Aricia agestis]|uniref:uncharacterized protein LOC121730985 n=1 Tax=Aricia agestis TaxID=91739 RepID=UPI001C20489F|nr:uncharacterized protein LOC121730985 [Aricia agestis]
MFSDKKGKKYPKSTQKIIRFADADTSLKQLGNPAATNTRKHLPKCYLDPKLCKCKSKTGHFKVWNSFDNTQKIQKDTLITKNEDISKARKVDKRIQRNRIVDDMKDEEKNDTKNIKDNKRKKIGDTCDADQCKKRLQYIQNLQLPEQKKGTKKNIGFGDQVLAKNDSKKGKDATEILKAAITSKGDKRTVDKKVFNGNPAMEIRVDSNKMQVLNPTEIKSKVKHLGTVKKNEVCICPSRSKRINQNSCEDGACAAAMKRKQGNFKCNCVKKNVQCNDLSCANQKRLSECLSDNVIIRFLKKIASCKDVADKLPKHLLEVTLDSANMNVVNSAELRDIFKKAYSKEICPNGVCRKGLEKNANVNCTCINKKLARNAIQCNSKTCNLKKKRKAEESRKKLKSTFATHTRIFGRSITSSGKRKKRRIGKRKGKNKLNKIAFRRDASLADNLKDCPEKTKKDCKQAFKREIKYYKKQEKKNRKATRKALKAIEKQKRREIGQWNCISNFLNGVINLIVQTIKIIITSVFTLITNPVRCFVYLKQKLKNPEKTGASIKQWFQKTWGRKNTKVSKMVQDSEAISVISDHIENMPFYDTVFVSKGKTKEERAMYERRKRLREKRMQKRHDEALYGCRNILLTTLRKTPCICFYYLCPNLYPQCLSLLTFLKNFYHIIIYLAALAFWTPCILTFEICRSLLCCLFCVG